MFDEQALNRVLADFETKLKHMETVPVAGGACDVWKKLRPEVVELTDVLAALGALFPKVKLAAQTLQALRGLLDSLCPGTVGAGMAGQLATVNSLGAELERALRPSGAAVAQDSPCEVWNRVKPVVSQIIAALNDITAEFSALAKVIKVLETLTQLAGELCGGAGAAHLEGTAPTAAGATAQVSVWEDDPNLVAPGTAPPMPAQLITIDVPNNTQPLLKTQISGPQPPAAIYGTTTPQFRYWNSEAALARGVNFWGPLLPPGTQWSSNSIPLGVGLDQGEDFNAYYSRQNGLNFFHGIVDHVFPHVMVYSGESPHVICHELGHAILDAVKPELFDAMSAEIAAFHESFGDMSSILTALQLESLRDDVLRKTGGRLNVNSRLSQLARQLGWAIRVQYGSDAADADCLRNAANRFFYRNPSGLPPSAPSTSLASEPHSFSRVFTGAFFDVLAGMYKIGPVGGGPSASDNLEAVARDAGTLLIEGLRLAAVAPGFYSQVAAGMIQADRSLFGQRYNSALVTSFVKRGILKTSAAVALVRDLQLVEKAFGVTGTIDDQRKLTFAGDNQGYRKTGGDAPGLRLAPIETSLGLTLHVHLPSEPKRFPMASATVAAGVPAPRSAEEEAQDFLEDLLQAGQVAHEQVSNRLMACSAAVVAVLASSAAKQKTHYLVEEDDKVVIKRHHFDCCFGDCGA